MIVCHCHRVTDDHVDRVLSAGGHTVRQVVRGTRAGTGCGGCLPQLRALCARRAQSDARLPDADEALAG
jgi:bacterioferritin-associated ferredoxin